MVPGVLAANDGFTAILEAAGLNGVCTDQQLTVVKAFGDTTTYLKNENFIFDLSDLLPDSVSVIVKAAAHRALESNQRVTLNELNFGGLGQYLVNIVISPFLQGGQLTGNCWSCLPPIKEKRRINLLLRPG